MDSKIDLERHKRHILLKEIGGPGVAKLASSSVSIVGAGALGGPCAMYLAAAGIGQIEIIDDDVVDRSNLQRQVQFTEADIGRSKAVVLAGRLEAMNASTSISVITKRFAKGDDVSGNVLIDACDNYETRYALNDLAHETGRAMVHGAAARWSGQVSVFASGLPQSNEDAPCYQCWVPEMPPEAEACDDVGVAGPVTGLVGTRMALETIKLACDAGTISIGKLWLLDGLTGQGRHVNLRKDKDCRRCGKGGKTGA
ncbi:MAG: HesA/MoeB/ThiF family protein [Hyphomonadaceae bacterium]